MSPEAGAPPASDLRLILASQSPRRRRLLITLGLDFDVAVSAVDEAAVIAAEQLSGEDPEHFVRVLAARKALDVASRSDGGTSVVIGADTIVVHDDAVLGKPTDLADACLMLTAISDQWIRVVSGVVVVDTSDSTVVSRTEVTRCRVGDIDPVTLDRYLAGGVWADKAGALAVQHRDPQLIATVDGCWANVAGLPICTVAQLLADRGMTIEPGDVCPGARRSRCALTDIEL